MTTDILNIVTVVLPCTYTGEYRVTFPLDATGEPDYSNLSDEDFEVLMTGITPAELERVAQRDLFLEPTQDQLVYEFLVHNRAYPGVQAIVEADLAELELRALSFYDQAIYSFMDERAADKLLISVLEDRLATQVRTIHTLIDEREMLLAGNREVGAAYFASEAANKVLKTEVRNVSDKVQRQRGALNGHARLLKDSEDILVQTARYVGRTRELLSEMGITIETSAQGDPSLSINLLELTNSVGRAFGE